MTTPAQFYNNVAEAFQQGYTPQQVVAWLLQSGHKIAPRIKEALRQGYNEDQIGEYLLNQSSMSRGQRQSALAGMTEREKAGRITQRYDKTNKQIGGALSQALPVAATVAAGTALAPVAATAAARLSPQLIQQATKLFPALAPLLQSVGGAQTGEQIPGVPQEQALEQTQSPEMQTQPTALIEQHEARPEQLEQGVSPDVVKQFLSSDLGRIVKNALSSHPNENSSNLAKLARVVYPSLAKEFEKESKSSLEDVVEASRRDDKLLGGTEEPTKLSKQDVVAAPQGIGSIREIRGNQALVDVSGKIHKVPVDELVAEPRDVKDTEIILDLSKVPEEMRSAVATIVQIPKSRMDVTVMPGLSGKFYRYVRKDGKPFDKELTDSFINEIKLPITKGAEFMGAWGEGGPSRGSALSKNLILQSQKKLDEEGREAQDDPSKAYWSEEVDDAFLHGYLEQFLDALREGEEHFKRRKATEELREGKRKRARKEKEIQRRFR